MYSVKENFSKQYENNMIIELVSNMIIKMLIIELVSNMTKYYKAGEQEDLKDDDHRSGE